MKTRGNLAKLTGLWLGFVLVVLSSWARPTEAATISQLNIWFTNVDLPMTSPVVSVDGKIISYGAPVTTDTLSADYADFADLAHIQLHNLDPSKTYTVMFRAYSGDPLQALTLKGFQSGDAYEVTYNPDNGIYHLLYYPGLGLAKPNPGQAKAVNPHQGAIQDIPNTSSETNTGEPTTTQSSPNILHSTQSGTQQALLGLPLPSENGPTNQVGDYQDYVRKLFHVAAVVASILAAVMIILAGLIYIVSQDDDAKTGFAKEMIVSALSGMVLLVLSNFFLQLLFTNPPGT